MGEDKIGKAFTQVGEQMYIHAKLINDLADICKGLDTSIEELRELYKKLEK